MKPEITMEELVALVNETEGEFVIQVSFGKEGGFDETGEEAIST